LKTHQYVVLKQWYWRRWACCASESSLRTTWYFRCLRRGYAM